MLKDARSAFKSRTNDSFGVGNPRKQSKTQPWFQPPSNCGRCSLLVAVAMKSTWQRSGRRVLMRSEWWTRGRVLKYKQNLRTNSPEHRKPETMCESKRLDASKLRICHAHLLHKNGAEWGSFIQEVLCLCWSVASCGNIGSQYVRPRGMMNATWGLTSTLKIGCVSTKVK